MKHKSSSTLLKAVITLGAGWAIPANAEVHQFDQMFVFGDSLSDNGNFCFFTNNFPCVPYFTSERFTSPLPLPSSPGRVWVEYLAEDLGLNPPEPSAPFIAENPNGPLALPPQGLNFAVSGATTGDLNLSLAPIPGIGGLEQQIVDYQHLLNNQTANPNALYVLWAGANDAIGYYQDNTVPPGATPPIPDSQAEETADNIFNALDTLAQGGAKHILVPNMLNLGDIPLAIERGHDVVEDLNQFTQDLNQALDVKLDELRQSYPGTDFIEFDAHSLFSDVENNPPGFGFDNANKACTATDLTDSSPFPPLPLEVCDSPEPYFYWDNQHPTTEAHALIAQSAMEQAHVPEPGTVGASILLALSLSKHWRKRKIKVKK